MHALNQQTVLKCMNGWMSGLFRPMISYKSTRKYSANYGEVTTQLC